MLLTGQTRKAQFSLEEKNQNCLNQVPGSLNIRLGETSSIHKEMCSQQNLLENESLYNESVLEDKLNYFFCGRTTKRGGGVKSLNHYDLNKIYQNLMKQKNNKKKH